MHYPIYISFEYFGNKEKEVESFKGYFYYMSQTKGLDLDKMNLINKCIEKRIYETTNLEYEDISDNDFIIICMKELY